MHFKRFSRPAFDKSQENASFKNDRHLDGKKIKTLDFGLVLGS